MILIGTIAIMLMWYVCGKKRGKRTSFGAGANYLSLSQRQYCRRPLGSFPWLRRNRQSRWSRRWERPLDVWANLPCPTCGRLKSWEILVGIISKNGNSELWGRESSWKIEVYMACWGTISKVSSNNWSLGTWRCRTQSMIDEFFKHR